MGTKAMKQPETPGESDAIAKLRSQCGNGSLDLTGTENALYERHLVFDNVVDLAAAGPRERFEAIAHSVAVRSSICTSNVSQHCSIKLLVERRSATFARSRLSSRASALAGVENEPRIRLHGLFPVLFLPKDLPSCHSTLRVTTR